MCKYCERRKDIGFGWEQPKLPYHEGFPSAHLSGNVLENEKWDGRIFDYQTCQPELHLTCPGYFGSDNTDPEGENGEKKEDCLEEAKAADN